MLSPRGVLLIAVAALWVCGASAQDADCHVTTDPARALCSESAYVHGYIHGYEEGFRQGDIEIRPAAVDLLRLAAENAFAGRSGQARMEGQNQMA